MEGTKKQITKIASNEWMIAHVKKHKQKKSFITQTQEERQAK